jgi:hypothetical protein
MLFKIALTLLVAWLRLLLLSVATTKLRRRNTVPKLSHSALNSTYLSYQS